MYRKFKIKAKFADGLSSVTELVKKHEIYLLIKIMLAGVSVVREDRRRGHSIQETKSNDGFLFCFPFRIVCLSATTSCYCISAIQNN